MAHTIYLEKANEKLICHCKCARALVSSPCQMDCPWCGCGWLFTCLRCRRAFTFARAVEIDAGLEDLARTHLTGFLGWAPQPRESADWIDEMAILLDPVILGHEYVYLDGIYVDTQEQAIAIEGWHSRHELPYVPHVKAMEDPSVLDHTLRNELYWRGREIHQDAEHSS